MKTRNHFNAAKRLLKDVDLELRTARGLYRESLLMLHDEVIEVISLLEQVSADEKKYKYDQKAE